MALVAKNGWALKKTGWTDYHILGGIEAGQQERPPLRHGA
jgi:hypothetical protein